MVVRVEDTLSRFRVLPLTSPVGFAPRPVWGPRCRRLGAQVNVTQKRDRWASRNRRNVICPSGSGFKKAVLLWVTARPVPPRRWRVRRFARLRLSGPPLKKEEQVQECRDAAGAW